MNIFWRVTAVSTVAALGFLDANMSHAQGGDEPIAYIGHGAIFDQSGSEIIPNLEFLSRAIEFYENTLIERLSDDDAKAFGDLRAINIERMAESQAEQLQVRAALLLRMAHLADFDDGGRTLGKLGVLARYANYDLSAIKREGRAWQLQDKLPEKEVFLNDFLERFGDRVPGIQKSVTGNSGEAYRQECLNAGVPVPLEFSNAAWVDYGQIPQSQLFIVAGLQATVRAMTSANPAGVCIALPRHEPETSAGAGDGNVILDGIICMGQSTGNVCFWDNQNPNWTALSPPSVPQTFEFPLNNPPAISNWIGGAQLNGDNGGVCSDCHSGENPYVIHPSSVVANGLGSVSNTLNLFPNSWPNPYIQVGWPENPGPMNSPGSCDFCHGDAMGPPGSAGRFPHLSTEIPGYCGTVLRSATGSLRPSLTDTNATPTMPTFSPGSEACTPNLPQANPNFRQCNPSVHTADCTPANTPNAAQAVSCTPTLRSMFDWCGLAANNDAGGRGDPHQTTVDNVRYDFQGAGEFVYLRSPTDRFELQARQTAVPSQGVIPANGHTGLASCVSVITAVAARLGKYRVTYQTPFDGDDEGPVLRINGKIVPVKKEGIDLGQSGMIKPGRNNGVILEAPNGTIVRIRSNFWQHHQIWYMNVEVENTPARDGVLGVVGSAGWLPNLEDGSSFGPRPASLQERHEQLNLKFADSWRVRDATSLFDYIGGMSTKDHTFPDWPPFGDDCTKAPGKVNKPTEPLERERAAKLCAEVKGKDRQQECIFDVMVTGDPGFAKIYQ